MPEELPGSQAGLPGLLKYGKEHEDQPLDVPDPRMQGMGGHIAVHRRHRDQD